MITQEHDEDVIDEREFRRLFGTEPHGKDDESLCASVGLPDLDCEGVFDEENPPSVDEDGEEVDDDGDEMMRLDTEINRDASLKRLGNSKHKPFNKNALTDGFEVGKVQLADIKSVRAKILDKEKKTDEHIKMAVDYFIVERNKRRRIMIDQTEKELSGQMIDCNLEDWERRYLDYLNNN